MRGYENTREPIAKELKNANHYAVYEPELSRVWPDNGSQRKLEIACFAKCMAGGCATISTDSTQFSIKIRLARSIRPHSQLRVAISHNYLKVHLRLDLWGISFRYNGNRGQLCE